VQAGRRDGLPCGLAYVCDELPLDSSRRIGIRWFARSGRRHVYHGEASSEDDGKSGDQRDGSPTAGCRRVFRLADQPIGDAIWNLLRMIGERLTQFGLEVVDHHDVNLPFSLVEIATA
jgi:hypothetical protein